MKKKTPCFCTSCWKRKESTRWQPYKEDDVSYTMISRQITVRVERNRVRKKEKQAEWRCHTEARKQLITFASSLLAAPRQALLTGPALWSHQFIARITQEVDFMAHAVWLSKFSPIDGCLQFWASAFKGETQFMKGQIFLTYNMNKSGLWWFSFTVNGSCRLLSRAALQQVYFLLKVAKALQVWCFMNWEKLLDLFQRALDFVSTWAVLEWRKMNRVNSLTKSWFLSVTYF